MNDIKPYIYIVIIIFLHARAVGGGGVLINSDGIQETIYSWGLGDETDNVIETLALWKGVCQA